MPSSPRHRVRSDLERLADRRHGVRDFAFGAARILARGVPFDGVCLLTMDPATSLPTSEVVENGLPDSVLARMTEIEMSGDDFNAFQTMGRAGVCAASLSDATTGELDRSVRHRELRRPNGFGDELRAVLADDDGTWGALTLLRAGDREDYTAAEVELIGSVSMQLTQGLRHAMLRAAPDPGQRTSHETGIALVAGDNSITRVDSAAEAWLAELGDDGTSGAVPQPVRAVATRARATGTAAARVRTASGTWLVVRGSALGTDDTSPTALVLEPAGPHELAPLMANAYELTERERAVSRLVAEGLSTSAIAQSLLISPWTVQDHLKSIFEKVRVTTRGELVARLFFEQQPPRLS